MLVVDHRLAESQIPAMDGLATAMCTHHPGVLVILITAYGTGVLATEALERGATSYVPRLAGSAGNGWIMTLLAGVSGWLGPRCTAFAEVGRSGPAWAGGVAHPSQI